MSNKVTAAAMRGRYKNNSTEQQIEISDREYSNALTTVQKDSLIAKKEEPTIIDDTQGFDGVRTYKDYAPALRANRSGLKVNTDYKIRKLTPKECWRLMGFADEDFAKAEAVNSNTQLYKQAGNSIVVPVVEGIIEELIECKALNTY